MLLAKGHSVIACDVNVTGINPAADALSVDLFSDCDSSVFERLGSPDVCVHMAWRNGFVHNSPTQMGDLSAHYCFLTAMIEGGLKQLAVMGSMHEVGYWEGAIDEDTPCNPVSLYAIAKDSLRRAMSQFCSQHSCTLQWIRGFYILGDDRRANSIFGKILRAADEGKKTFPFTTGKNKYDFMTVDELASQIAAVVSQSEVTGIINCCTGNPISLAEKVESFIKEHELDIKLEYGAFPDRPYDSPCIYGNPDKIRRILDSE